jgi:hypothetical protein
MYFKSLILLIMMFLLSRPLSAQTLYNESLGANTYGNLSINDGGSTFRGGAHFQPFVDPTRSATLFQGGVQTGGMCNFDLIAGFKEKFEELPDLMLQLAGPLALGFGLQILCESAPSYCDIVKQLYQSANLTLRAQFGRCQDLVLTGMSLATASQREALKKCVEDKQAQGASIEVAMQTCPGEIHAPGGINGVEAPDFGIVETVLASTGVSPERIAQITQLAGEVRLMGNGQAFAQAGSKQQDAVFETYQQILEETAEALTTTVDALAGGAIPSPDVLGKLGGPGFPASADALLEIANETDVELRHYEIRRYAGNIAYSKMVWDIHELADTLQDATESSALTPEIRSQLEAKQRSLRRQVTRIQDMRQASTYMERHVEALLARKARRQQEVANVSSVGLGGPIVGRYATGQTAMGYQR